jgi:purine-nucleoside phosphorylase
MWSDALLSLRPKVAVVLGSGLGAFADTLQSPVVIPYNEIPGWPQSTAVGHAGKLVVGAIDGLPVAALAGRAHLYEGYTAQQSVHGIRVLAQS